MRRRQYRPFFLLHSRRPVHIPTQFFQLLEYTVWYNLYGGWEESEIMTTKEKLHTRAARIREEAARTGRVVLHAPTLIRGAEYAIRFLLGAILSGAQIFGGYAPFGVAMVGASGSGIGGFAALLGACFGYFTFLGFVDSLRYIAASILTFSVAFAFYDIRLYRKSWFMPVVTALLCAVTGFVYLSDQGWHTSDVIFFGTELLFAGTGVYFYRLAFSPWTAEGELEFNLQQTVSLFIFAGTVLISLSQITLLRDISLGRIAAALSVMLVAYKGKPGMGAAFGVSVGLAMDLASGGGPYYSMAYGLSGLITGVFWKESRLFADLAYVLANAVAVLWTWDSGVRISELYEIFIASVLFLMVPNGALRRIGALLVREESGEAALRAGQYVRIRLEETAKAFRELYEALRDAFRPGSENAADVSTVFDRAANRVCCRCGLRDSCWQRDYVTTFNALNDATAAMVDRGRAVPSDFPLHFSSRCMRFQEFLAAANEELTAYLCRRQYQSRIGESRQAVCRQYAELGYLLNRAAAQAGARLPADPGREKTLRGHLAALGVEGASCCYYDENGHLRVETADDPLLRTPEETDQLSAALGIALRMPEAEGDRLVFTQAEPLMAVAGVAAQKREGETVTGDAGAFFHRIDGALYILLCDGMGSGTEANRDSTLTVRLLERFLQAGVEAEPALKTLNSALALRGEALGGFTAIDLLEIDLFTGDSILYKFGAAPTYVRKKDTVSRFTGSALPAGLTTGTMVRPDITHVHLEPGDCVVLVSDGITDGAEDVWLRDALRGFDGSSPKDLARRLIDESGGKSQAADDRTAMVVLLADRPAKCSNN